MPGLFAAFEPLRRLATRAKGERRSPVRQRLAAARRLRVLRIESVEERTLLSVVPQCQYDEAILDKLDSSALAGGLTPVQIRGAYGIDRIALGSIQGDGAGQTIAIVVAYDSPSFVSSTSADFLNSDLHVFDAVYGIADPPSFLKLDQYGGTNYPAANSDWAKEIALDVEWAHAIAPGANIVLVEANSDSQTDFFAAVDTARNLPNVSVVSMSWGGVDGAEKRGDPHFTTPIGHAGVTFVASSGDGGAPGVYPAFSSNVLAVGGTSLTVSGSSYVSETAWSWDAENQWGTGGGQSIAELEPDYQTSFQDSGWRQIPDVSFDADPFSGVSFYDSYGFGGWGNVGGTSLSAPCWAGLIAIANQLRADAGRPTLNAYGNPTQVQTLLYQMAGSPEDYNSVGYHHDIVEGNNNGYSAAPGYDMVTGLGTPVADKLVPALVAVTSAGSIGFSASSYASGVSPIITVVDLDGSGLSACSVVVTSASGDSETIWLSAIGSGIFQGSFRVGAGAPASGDGIVEVGAGEVVTAVYYDADDGTGNAATVAAQATVAAPIQLAILATDTEKAEGNTGTTSFTFTIVRTGNTADVTTVNYAVVGEEVNPADAADFGASLPNGTLTFAPGETSQTLIINVSGDLLVEPDEEFTVTLSEPSAGSEIVVAAASGIILNDDVVSVVGRYIFYNNSYFDGNSQAADARDDNAIATDKSALLPGQKASFVNYTSYSRGINGIMVDIAGVAGPITADDFAFKVGNSNNPADGSKWITAPSPTATWRPLENGVIRVTLIWADNAIQKRWLQVKVLASANTGLATPNVFYFGNAIGESGDSPTNAWVNATDAVAVGKHLQLATRTTVTNPYDYNRDGLVNATDAVLAGNNVAIGSAALQLITPIDNQRYVAALMAVWRAAWKPAGKWADAAQLAPARSKNDEPTMGLAFWSEGTCRPTEVDAVLRSLAAAPWHQLGRRWF